MRKIYWIFGLLLIMGALICFHTCSKEGDINGKAAGLYIVDLQKSDSSFSLIEKAYYTDLELILSKNGDFKFTRSVPNGEPKEGSWRIEGNNLERHLTLDYKNGYSIATSYYTDTGCIMYISVPVYDRSIPCGLKDIPFRKIK